MCVCVFRRWIGDMSNCPYSICAHYAYMITWQCGMINCISCEIRATAGDDRRGKYMRGSGDRGQSNGSKCHPSLSLTHTFSPFGRINQKKKKKKLSWVYHYAYRDRLFLMIFSVLFVAFITIYCGYCVPSVCFLSLCGWQMTKIHAWKGNNSVAADKRKTKTQNTV